MKMSPVFIQDHTRPGGTHYTTANGAETASGAHTTGGDALTNHFIMHAFAKPQLGFIFNSFERP